MTLTLKGRVEKLIQKLFALAVLVGLIVSLADSTPAHDEKKDRKPGEKIERSLTVAPQAIVTLCVASGTLIVHGWDKNEVRVRSLDAAQIDFRRIDKAKEPQTPANRVDVMVYDKTSRMNPKLDCQAVADVEMEVPTGATVQVQTRDGDIHIAGVAGAYAGSQNGDIMIERVTKLVEAGSVGGSISLRDSSGRVNLSSAGGGVQAANVRGADGDDTFEVGTVSGDIQLDKITSPTVMAKTVNGTLTMSGALVKSGNYAFTNMTGDVVLALPHDASFRLKAKVSEKKSLLSEFPLTYIGESQPASPAGAAAKSGAAGKSDKAVKGTPERMPVPHTPTPRTPPAKTPPAAKGGAVVEPIIGPVVIERTPVVVPYPLRRIEAICGSGDATISVASFGGTVRLKKL